MAELVSCRSSCGKNRLRHPHTRTAVMDHCLASSSPLLFYVRDVIIWLNMINIWIVHYIIIICYPYILHQSYPHHYHICVGVSKFHHLKIAGKKKQFFQDWPRIMLGSFPFDFISKLIFPSVSHFQLSPTVRRSSPQLFLTKTAGGLPVRCRPMVQMWILL